MPARPRPPSRSRRRLGAVLVAATAAASLTLVAPTTSGAQEAAPEGAPALTVAPVVSLSGAIAMATWPGSDDLFVATRGGQVRRLEVTGDTVVMDPTPLLDISDFTDSDGEGGLLGLAFNPTGDRLYLDHTNVRGNLRIVEYTVDDVDGAPQVVPGSRRKVLSIRHQPFGNHNGGNIAFGPDGKLYIAVGDGGGGGDPFANGQNRQVLLGKILRINPAPTATRPYRSPPTNPYVGQSPRRPEIWLYGVRNPWRFSFDAETGDLVVADVGQDVWEEVDVLPNTGANARGRGANLGWNRMEGTDIYSGTTEPANHTPPTFEYPHPGSAPDPIPSGLSGCSIIGGYVYRGAAIPSLAGRYLFGDFCTGTLSSMAPDGSAVVADLGASVADNSLLSFGEGPDGELYVLTFSGVSRLEPAGS